MATSNLNAEAGSGYSSSSLIIAATVSTLGGLLFGYDNIVISGAIGYLSILFHLDAAGVGWAAACALVGCIFGCAAAGTVADFLGKKKVWGSVPFVSRCRRSACFLRKTFRSLYCGG